ncbi:M61 metallopeptidase family protein [Chryseobacterium paridis]|uniref:Peptidase M61 n=1 Tax=Chryseobacterium paridis TaxID=2800328 RepID=A0ABS1FUC4_9FLAO|nr:hypothetical protein [Chryseobacterium paridis]MBK1896027.1 hypothetical protein [Chryseobacterium paridis]
MFQSSIIISFFFLLGMHLGYGQSAEINLKFKYDNKANPTGIDVTYTLSEDFSNNTERLLFLYDKMYPLQRSSDTISNLRVTDRLGAFPLKLQTNDKSNNSDYMSWSALRAQSGPLTVSYYVPLAPRIALKSGPVKDLQAAGDGLSGAIGSFLLFPDHSKKITINLHWMLNNGQEAVCSQGFGRNISFQTSIVDLFETQFLAGSLYSHASSKANMGFSMYGLGQEVNSELNASADWYEKAYKTIRGSLNGSPTSPFYYFFRSYDGNPMSSGRATNGSFLLYLPKQMSMNDEDTKVLSAHEMIHVFVSDLVDDDGLTDWYVEGIADYLSVKLLYDAHLINEKKYLEVVNGQVAEYYTNKLRSTPNKEIPKVMWSGTNAWTTPYTRGSMYFADLEGKLKQHKAKVTVLSLINTMDSMKKRGEKIDPDSWANLLKKDAGAWAVADYESMLAGNVIIPVDNAFGEKFKRKPVKARFFDLGFEYPKSIKVGEQIKNLRTNSLAAKAGLKEGDIINSAVDLIPLYRSYSKLLTIEVKRNGKVIPITYAPRSEVASAYKWTTIR